MHQQISEALSRGSEDVTAAIVAEPVLIVEEHPLFPEWLGAFEHLIKCHERLKTAAPDSPHVLDLQKGLAAAKAAYLKLANELD